MNTNGTLSLPTPTSFSFHPPDPASSGLGSSSQSTDPIFLNTNFSTNPPSASNTVSSDILSTPSSFTADSSSLGHFAPLNNATNNAISMQLLPSHGTSGLQSLTDTEQNARENIPPSQSAKVSSNSKRKSDLDGNASGPSLKKARTLPNGQEPSQTQVMIVQEPRAGAELTHQLPNQQPQGSFNGAQNACIPAEIPPEIAAIDVELNGLISFPLHPSVEFPSCNHLLTTMILREDVPRIETRFYPYLWFHGRAPYMLKGEDYGNIFPVSHIGAMQRTMRRLGIVCGTLGLTASKQCVLFFDREEKKVVQDAVKKLMGDSFNNAKWQGAMEIPRQQQSGPGSNASQLSTGQSGHQMEQSGLSSQHPLNNLATTHHTQPNAPQPQSTASYYGPSVANDSQPVGKSSDSAVAESSASSQTRSMTPRHPVQNPDPFILVSNDMAKRRRNGPSSAVPILTSVPDTPQAVSGPSMSYPTNTVFAETHTKESFPHPQNTNAAAAPKRKSRRRAPAKSGDKGQNTAIATQSQLQLEEEVAPKSKAQRGKSRGKKAQDPEPPQIQAGPSGSTAPEPQTRETQPIYSVPQVSSTIPQDNPQASGSYTQPQIGLGYTGNVGEYTPFNSVVTRQTPVEFNANGGCSLPNLSDQQYQELITPALEQDLMYDGFQQPFYLSHHQGLVPSFPESSAGSFPGDGQTWNFSGV